MYTYERSLSQNEHNMEKKSFEPMHGSLWSLHCIEVGSLGV